MPLLRILLICVLSPFVATPAQAQSPARDELHAWPVADTRPMVTRGPAAAPRGVASAPAAAIVDRPIIDGAVQQAGYQSAFDRDPPSPARVEASPSDAMLPLPPATEITTPPAPMSAREPVAEPAGPLPAPRIANATGGAAGGATGGVTGDSKRRLLAPRSTSASPSIGPRPTSFGQIDWQSFSSDSMTTVGASLAIVLGLVMLMAWVWRRAAPRSSRPLPDEVVSVIGRVPLAGKQMAQLIKIGGKLVLVCVTPEGAKPLTEITDPEEVARLLGLCEQASPHSATAAFREVFAEITREPAAPGFLGDEAPLLDRQKLADAYANTPGGRAYG